MALDLSQLTLGIVDPLVVLWNSFITVIPGLIAALVILIIGYAIAALLGLAVKHALKIARLDKWMEKTGKSEAIGGIEISEVTGKLVKWWVFVLFLVPASSVIQLDSLAQAIAQLALWFPNLIIAVIVVLFGLVLAHFFGKTVSTAKKLKGIKIASTVVYAATLLVFLDVALRQIGIKVDFAENIILIVVAGVMLAVAIGFGLGLKPYAEQLIKSWKNKLK